MSGRDPVEALTKKDNAATHRMKKLADAAIQKAQALTTADEKKAAAAVERAATLESKKLREQQERFWNDATKILVPAYWGNCDAQDGLALARRLSPAGVLALILLGLRTDEGPAEPGNAGECEVGMQMRLRPSGFDRQEARVLAERGFSDLKELKFLKRTTAPKSDFPYGYYLLSAKGVKAYDIIRRSATGRAG